MRVLLLVLAFVLTPGIGRAATPTAAELVDRISEALGGGGAAALARSGTLDFIFRRVARDAISKAEITAEHRYQRSEGGRRQRLDIRTSGSSGKPSTSIVDGASAWLIVDGAVHELRPDQVLDRLPEFAPERLFSVPLALASDGRTMLGDADLAVEERAVGADRRWVLVGRDAEGVELARLEVDVATSLPLEVAFASPAGAVVFRYSDYRRLGPDLVLPFEREFLRDGLLVSRTTVRRLDLVRTDADAFAPGEGVLSALPPATAGGPPKAGP